MNRKHIENIKNEIKNIDWCWFIQEFNLSLDEITIAFDEALTDTLNMALEIYNNKED